MAAAKQLARVDENVVASNRERPELDLTSIAAAGRLGRSALLLGLAQPERD